MYILKNKASTLFKNIVMLYILSISKLLFPLITLPYLTRVLSIDYYGVTAYIKSCMIYFQLFLDFGFILSATKNVVEVSTNRKSLGGIAGSVSVAKLVLAMLSVIVLWIMVATLPILRDFKLYAFISFAAVLFNSLLPDYIFRGLNEMQVISYRFVLCKGASVVLTLLLVKSDQDILLIPILDLLSSVLAFLMTVYCMHVRDIIFRFINVRDVFLKLKESAVYFLSDFATASFGALNTLLVGIYLGLSDVAYWSVAMQLISAAQALYSPVISGVYPQMVETHNFNIIKKLLIFFMPLILFASACSFVFAHNIIAIISGAKYVGAASVFRYLVPVLIISFPSMLFGWPCLGAISKAKETTVTTILASFVQIVLLVIMIISDNFTLITVAISRNVSELSLLISRYHYCHKFKNDFIS